MDRDLKIDMTLNFFEKVGGMKCDFRTWHDKELKERMKRMELFQKHYAGMTPEHPDYPYGISPKLYAGLRYKDLELLFNYSKN